MPANPQLAPASTKAVGKSAIIIIACYLRSRIQVLAFGYKPKVCSWVHVVAGMERFECIAR
jgi:hypothetical protein